MAAFWILFSILGLILIITYNWKRRNLYLASMQYEGSFALPIIGNALTFYCNNDELFAKCNKILSQFKSPFRFWLGPELILCFPDPNHVEKIMSSSRFSHKHKLYDLLKPVIGEGLISNSGPKYKAHRRIIQPMLNAKWCENILNVFQKHIEICMKELEKFAGTGITFDIEPIFHHCFADILSDVILGFPMNSQRGENLEYVEAYEKIYEMGFARVIKPWLRSEFVLKITTFGKDFQKYVDLTQELIEKAKIPLQERKLNPEESYKDFVPIMDQISYYIDQNPGSINNEDFIAHMATLYSASEDTHAAISSCITTCLGMYPEYQRKAYEEISELVHDDFSYSMELLNKMKYLDMCVKDALRLMPIAPHIVRKVLEDDKIDKWDLPKGSAVLIPIYKLHHDEKHWENPKHFHPDHFLPEAVKKRHIYCYLPFSAGSRNCVGKIMANMGLKLIMCNVLRRFEIEADGKFDEFKLKTDISVRPMDGYKVRLKIRN